jgi:uncharacterized iron-regulated protein
MREKVYDPRSFLVRKVLENDVVLLGGNHRRPFILECLADALPALREAGLTHLGLEITSEQQPAIDRFMAEGEGLEEIDIFHVIDCPEYRDLIRISQKTPLAPLALDLPRSYRRNGQRRDQWMAGRIGHLFRKDPTAKMIAVLGNLHVMKSVEWLDPRNTGRFLPSYLKEVEPGLRVYSIITEPHTPAFSDLDTAFAMDAAGIRHHISLLNFLAAAKQDACRITDGLIFCR